MGERVIAWRIHTDRFHLSQLLLGPVYGFTKEKTALWYREKYMNGRGTLIKIYGYGGEKHKDHPDQRIFIRAIILEEI